MEIVEHAIAEMHLSAQVKVVVAQTSIDEQTALLLADELYEKYGSFRMDYTKEQFSGKLLHDLKAGKSVSVLGIPVKFHATEPHNVRCEGFYADPERPGQKLKFSIYGDWLPKQGVPMRIVHTRSVE